MRSRERYALAEELRSRYRGTSRVEREQLLDSFCLATGDGRKYAIRCSGADDGCHCARESPRAKRYGPWFQSALKICWEVACWSARQAHL